MRHEVETAAAPEQVWKAWTDPGFLAQWFPDRAEGAVIPGSTLTWAFDSFGASFPYEIVEVDAGRRVVMQCGLPGAPGALIEFTLSHGDGVTKINLVASGFGEGAEWEDEYEGTNSGWRSVLATMREYLEHHFGKGRWIALQKRPADFEYEGLIGKHVMGDGLSRWLVESGRLGGEGSEFDFALRDGGRMSGRVLAVTKREIPLYWREMDGVLTLMASPGENDQRLVIAHLSSWGPRTREVAALKVLGLALDRLVSVLLSG
jgi:uncharacterized protein YndB with AHSA1/START domain